MPCRMKRQRRSPSHGGWRSWTLSVGLSACLWSSLPGSLPGAAARGIFIIWRLVFSIWTVLVQPIGLVDYVSLKKSIWRVRLFSRRFLKQFIDDASRSSWERLFHRFITRWEKKYNRVSQQQFLFTSLQLCPLVTVHSALWKKRDQGVDDNPFAILKTSIRSPTDSVKAPKGRTPNEMNNPSPHSQSSPTKISVRSTCQ